MQIRDFYVMCRGENEDWEEEDAEDEEEEAMDEPSVQRKSDVMETEILTESGCSELETEIAH
jgi:hypothetical protein